LPVTSEMALTVAGKSWVELDFRQMGATPFDRAEIAAREGLAIWQ
jgi:hypothetical protein